MPVRVKRVFLGFISAVILLSLLALLVSVVITDMREARDAARKEELLHKELISSGLIGEQIELEREIKRLSDKEADRLPTVTFLFCEPDALIYDSIRPVMSIFGVHGTISISLESMPGDVGNLTVEQYRGLIKSGYSTAALYDGETPLDEYLAELSGRAHLLGIEMPKVLYVCGKIEGSYFYLTDYDEEGKPIFTNELKTVLDFYGIEQVVQETYQSKIVAYQNFYEPLYYCESLGYNAMNENIGRLASGSLYETFKNKAAVVYSINFDFDRAFGAFYGEYDTSVLGGDGSTADDFARMLAAINDYGSSLRILDVGGVAKYRKEYNEKLELDLGTDLMLKSLRERLCEVELGIAAITDKYK